MKGFGLGKKPSTFGLDIGSSAIKVIELKEGKGSAWGLTAFAQVPLPHDVISEGSIKEPALVSDAVKECVQKAGVKGTAAVISVSGREAIMKRVPLPKVTAKELADAITLEAEHHIPFAVDDVFLDYQVVGESANSMSVVLVAVKKVKILEYVAVVEQAGFEALVVDLDAFAIQNQFELNHPAVSEEAVALIDIGASVMKTNVVRGGASIFARDVPFGGHHYTQAIAQRLDIPFEKAEAAKHGQDVGVAWDDLVPALEAVSRDLSLEVQRTFDYFASTREHDAPVSRASTNSLPRRGGCRWRSPDRWNVSSRKLVSSRPRSWSRPARCWPSEWGSGCGAPGTRTHDPDQPRATNHEEGWRSRAPKLQCGHALRRPCPPPHPGARRMVVEPLFRDQAAELRDRGEQEAGGGAQGRHRRRPALPPRQGSPGAPGQRDRPGGAPADAARLSHGRLA